MVQYSLNNLSEVVTWVVVCLFLVAVAVRASLPDDKDEEGRQ